MQIDAETIDVSSQRAAANHPVDEIIRYGLILGLIALSGNPAVRMVLGGVEPALLLFSMVLAVLAAYAVYSGQGRMSVRAIWPFAVFAGLLMVHSFAFQIVPLKTYLGFLCRLFIGFAIFLVVPRFPRRFTDLMYVMSIAALGFWLLGVTGLIKPVLSRLALQDHITASLLVHTYHYVEDGSGGLTIRNMGMFWEPGAFAGYLILALLFLGAVARDYDRRKYRRRLVVFSVCLLTTMSTAGYLLMPLAWGFHLIVLRKHVRLSRVLLIITVIVAAAVWAYFHIDFIGEKITYQWERTIQSAQSVEGQLDMSDKWYHTRIGSMIFDWDYIKRRPLTGWGISLKTRYALHEGGQILKFGMGNGLTDFTARFGLVGMLAFFIFSARGFAILSGRRRAAGVVAATILLLSLNGETFLNYPLYLSLLFLPYGAECCQRARRVKQTAEQPGTQQETQGAPC